MEEMPTLIICNGTSIINYNELQLNAPKIHYDLPARGKRLVQKALDMTTLLCPAYHCG